MSEIKELEKLEKRFGRKAKDVVGRSTRFPVEGGQFLPDTRRSWFDRPQYSERPTKAKAR